MLGGCFVQSLILAVFVLSPFAVPADQPTCDCEMLYWKFMGDPLAACPIVTCDSTEGSGQCDEVPAQAPAGQSVIKCVCSDLSGNVPTEVFDDECACDGHFNETTGIPDCQEYDCDAPKSCSVQNPLPVWPTMASCKCGN